MEFNPQDFAQKLAAEPVTWPASTNVTEYHYRAPQQAGIPPSTHSSHLTDNSFPNPKPVKVSSSFQSSSESSSSAPNPLSSPAPPLPFTPIELRTRIFHQVKSLNIDQINALIHLLEKDPPIDPNSSATGIHHPSSSDNNRDAQ